MRKQRPGSVNQWVCSVRNRIIVCPPSLPSLSETDQHLNNLAQPLLFPIGFRLAQEAFYPGNVQAPRAFQARTDCIIQSSEFAGSRTESGAVRQIQNQTL